jgi:hypothetical protein
LKHGRLSFQKEIGWQIACQPGIYRNARWGLCPASLRIAYPEKQSYTMFYERETTTPAVSFLGESALWAIPPLGRALHPLAGKFQPKVAQTFAPDTLPVLWANQSQGSVLSKSDEDGLYLAPG